MGLPAGTTAINLGCGLSVAPGWRNIDNSPNARLSKYPLIRWILFRVGLLSKHHFDVNWPKSIEIHNVRKRLPYADSSVDYAYTSHFLEHLAPGDAQRLILEIFRVLKPGGVVRIVVPDLAVGARKYLKAIESNPLDAEAGPEFLNWLQLGKPGVRDPHLWMYDAASLAAMLHQAGFVKAVICEYRKGRVPDCGILDNRPDDSLHVEADKP